MNDMMVSEKSGKAVFFFLQRPIKPAFLLVIAGETDISQLTKMRAKNFTDFQILPQLLVSDIGHTFYSSTDDPP